VNAIDCKKNIYAHQDHIEYLGITLV